MFIILIVNGIAADFSLVVDVGPAAVEIDAVGVDVDNIVLFNVFVFVIVVESVAAFNNCVAVTAVSVSVVVDIIDISVNAVACIVFVECLCWISYSDVAFAVVVNACC